VDLNGDLDDRPPSPIFEIGLPSLTCYALLISFFSAARDGANIIIAAKTTSANPKLEGTIYSAAVEIERAGGKALAVPCDVRDYSQIEKAVELGVEKFGGIDIVVNNASAIHLTGTLKTSPKTYDLMNQVNARGTFRFTLANIPYLSMFSAQVPTW